MSREKPSYCGSESLLEGRGRIVLNKSAALPFVRLGGGIGEGRLVTGDRRRNRQSITNWQQEDRHGYLCGNNFSRLSTTNHEVARSHTAIASGGQRNVSRSARCSRANAHRRWRPWLLRLRGAVGSLTRRNMLSIPKPPCWPLSSVLWKKAGRRSKMLGEKVRLETVSCLAYRTPGPRPFLSVDTGILSSRTIQRLLVLVATMAGAWRLTLGC